MSVKRKYKYDDRAPYRQERSKAGMGLKILGVGIIAGVVLVCATRRVFDEIFVEDDWSDVDWGEEDGEDYGID